MGARIEGIPRKLFLCSRDPQKYFFDFGVSCSLKYAFVPVFPVLFSFCFHAPKKLMAMFPGSFFSGLRKWVVIGTEI